MSANPENQWTVARLLAWTREHFERQRLDAPRLCAEILLAHALDCPRIKLFTQHESTPDPATLARFRELVRQAAGGTPIAYLTGVKDFFSLSFRVTPDVLIPRPETEILVERAIDLVRRSENKLGRILDVGTGSGCIAIALARHLPSTAICASDLSEAALAVARENAARLNVGDRIQLRCGDLLTPWIGAADGSNEVAESRFDIVIANLPYIGTDEAAGLPRNVRDHEPHTALFAGADGLALNSRLIFDAPGVVADGGHLLLEVGHRQADAVRGLLGADGWTDVRGYRDGAGIERVVHARRR